MAITQANRTTQVFGVEATPNTEPLAATIQYLGPNTISGNTPKPEKISRDPIGPNNQREAGAIIRTPVAAQFDGDVTGDHLRAFIEGALGCALTGTAALRFAPTSVSSTAYVVGALGALVAGTLVYGRGFATAANNGLHIVGAASDATNIKCSGLTAETLSSGQGATVEVCGMSFAASDAEIDASGNFKTTIFDLTTLGLVAGQTVFVGGPSTVAASRFAVAANLGQARIATAPTAHSIPFDATTTTAAFSTDNGNLKTIYLCFGQTARVCPTTAANYVEKTYMIEVGHATLSAGSPAYGYTTGCSVDKWTINAPTASKMTMSVSFQGQGFVNPTLTRKTNFAAPLAQVAKAMMNTADHVIRGRLRSGSTLLTGYITAVTLDVATGLTQQEAHGQQGPVQVSYGDRTVDAKVTAFFSTMEVMPVITANTLCNADWCFRSGGDEWGVVFDIPACEIGGGDLTITPGKLTEIALNAGAVRDSTFNTSLIVSLFPYLPAL